MKHQAALIFLIGTALSATAMAQPASGYGPAQGERELSLAGTGSSESDFDNGNFGISGEVGWYLRDNIVAGLRQSVNYASIEGKSLTDDFWNGRHAPIWIINSVLRGCGPSSVPASA